MRRATIFYSGVASLLLASSTYILFRPMSLLMFQWANALGLLPSIESARFHTRGLKGLLPEWSIYSLPLALWIVSYLLFINAIWFGRKSVARHFWLWLVPLLSIAAEVGQYPRLVPGTFDPVDLLTIIVATGLVLTFVRGLNLQPQRN